MRNETGGKDYHTDYDSVTLAGRKFYWHNNKFNPNKNFLEGIESDYIANAVDMEYVKENETFKFYVYFDNITPNQLNQLYASITYGDNDEEDKNDMSGKKWNLCHKLGHGKPLGFGSVKVIADKVYVRSFVGGEYTEDKDYKPCTVEIPEDVKIAINFNSIPNDQKIDYPRYNGNGDIFEWFSENRKFPNNQYYQILPSIMQLNQTLPKNPKIQNNQTNNISSETISQSDIKIICRDCGNEFLFTVSEQEFYKEKGFNNKPNRCKSCRDKKKKLLGK